VPEFALTAICDATLQSQVAALIQGAVTAAGAKVRNCRAIDDGFIFELSAEKSAGTTASPRARAAELRRAAAAALAERKLPVDLAASPAEHRQLPELLVLDMDSTLITIEVIDELGRRHGVGAEIAEITERAMRGELDFEASLRARVAKLAGLRASALDEVAAALTLSPGAEHLISSLLARGAAVAIASGGFTFAATALKQRLGLTAAYANQLEVAGGALTGDVLGEVITAERKAEVVRELAAARGVPAERTAAIGDGANDRLMLAASGFGVAFRAKPVLAGFADAAIDHGGLDRVLAFLS
jgi:phosphoserine phosphatase